jgi:predicted dehydrogenase/D-arabinose 1-dehydrogenase-like Zn-dependent alcohol dehydrogenase
MKQVLQDMAKGGTMLVEAPVPQVTANHVLIDTTVSLISTGTERMLVDFGKASLIQKARSQPDKVRQVLSKVKTDGLMTTVDAVRSKLGEPLALGYCNVGRVSVVGKGVAGFQPGDRVVSNGPHADVVRVSENLSAKIPDNVSDEAASFTVVAAIGLQGIRLAQPTLGEAFVVTGVGLIGLLTVQMLRAQGCRVLAIDFDAAKLDLAAKLGAEVCNPGMGQDPVAAGMAFSRGNGVDGVIITASTKSSDPVSQAAQMCRQRGRIVLVGVTGLELSRADFYEKELRFQVSCSYGPGRYDPAYEQGGQDYPIGFVRWTEQRNFEAVLDLMAGGQIDTSVLTTHRFAFEKAPEAYNTLTEDQSALGIILEYNHSVEDRHVDAVQLKAALPTGTDPVIGFVGAGNYASRMLILAFKTAGVNLHTIASSGGTSAVVHGGKTGFANATSNTDGLIANPEINTVAIVTRHNSHARLTVAALQAGKNVFVEKPLAMNHDELAEVQAAYAAADQHLMVGFNRRFAPQIQTMKKLLDATTAPKSFVMVMNAGAIPADHWTQDLAVGGGRIIGEACHYIDLMRFLAGSKITSVQARRMGNTVAETMTEDKAAVILGFEDGSFGTIHYLANGGNSFPKERIEVFAEGGTLQLDNFLKLRGYSWRGFTKQNLLRQDKGQKACVAAFIAAIKSGAPTPIPPEELFEVASVTLDVADKLRTQG